MVSIKCPDCGYEFSSFASACSRCGCFQALFADKNNSIATDNSPVKTNLNVGDTIKFGSYPQKSNGTRKPIEWRILERRGNRALLISAYALDCQPYNTTRVDITWETCTLRTWLNGPFLNMAFSTEEQKRIVSTSVSAEKNPEYSTDPEKATTDKVFLLSIQEAETYFSRDDARTCKPTAYAKAQGEVSYKYNGNCWWWLRTLGGYQDSAAGVLSDGSVNYKGLLVDYVSGDAYAVRPALWIALASSIVK